MSNTRRTSLHVALYSLGGTDYLAYARAFGLKFDDETDDGRGIADRWENHYLVKQGASFDFEVEMAVSSALKTNLEVTTFTIGGTAYIADLRSGYFEITNNLSEGSAARDRWKAPNAISSSLELGGTLFMDVAGSAALNSIHVNSAVSAQYLAYSLDFGGVTLSGNGVLLNPQHKADRGEIQAIDITLKSRGAPTAGGHGLLTAAAGTASINFKVDTGAGIYGHLSTQFGLIERLRCEISDAQINKITGTIRAFEALQMT